MKKLNLKVTGIVPLMEHDDKLANPFHPLAVELKKITGKRKKTEDDYIMIAKIEWLGGLYHEDNGSQNGYFIKSECFEGTFLAAAKTFKAGTQFKRSVSIIDNPVLIFPDWNKTPEQLFEMAEYKDFRTVKIGGSKVIRCRPRFNEWSCDVTVLYDQKNMDEELLKQIILKSQEFGVCDYRPKYGRFNVKFLNS